MKDVQVLINPITSQVILNKKRLGLGYENLQGKIIVTFDGDFVDGVAYLEIERNGEKGYLAMTKEDNAYTLEIKSSLLNKVGQINMQVRITEDQVGDEIPVWKSNIFYLNVDKAINSTSEIPDEYPQWIDEANEKFEEFDRLDIDVTKVNHTSTVTVTKKDGSTESVEILDGEQGPQGEPGVPGAIKFLIVQELPTTDIQTDTMYLVPKGDPQTTDLYDEYIYANNQWELIGEKQIDVDLSNYYTKTETNTLLLSKQDIIPVYYFKPQNASTYIGWGQYGQLRFEGDDFSLFVEILNEAHERNQSQILIINTGTNHNWVDTIACSLYDTDFTAERATVKLTHVENSAYFSNYHSYGQNNSGQNIAMWNMGVEISNGRIVGRYLPWDSKFIKEDIYLSVNNSNQYTPTNDYNPSTKKYVDDKASSVQTQYSTMPTASASNLGKIVQYIGTTDNTYTNGHFYQVVSDGEQTPTYSWSEISFGGGGTSLETYKEYHFIDGYMYNRTDFIFGDQDKVALGSLLREMYESNSRGGKLVLINRPQYYYIKCEFDVEFPSENEANLFIPYRDRPSWYGISNSDPMSLAIHLSNWVITNVNTSDTIFKTLTTTNIEPYTPTDNYNPATKKYVDDSVGGLLESPRIIRNLNLSSAIMSSFSTINTNTITGTEGKPIFLKLINDTIQAGLTSVYFVNKADDYYMLFKLIVPAGTIGTDSARLFMYPDPANLSRLRYGNAYWYSKTMNVVFTDNVATNITVNSGSGYSSWDWPYIGTHNNVSFTPTNNYQPATKKYVDDLAKITSVTNSNATYTISSLAGNQSYKLGEITSLTIIASTASDYESVIYFESGSTPTEVTIPNTITNLGDNPTFTNNVGTCTANKKYIIAILNNIAVWKEY